MSASDGNEDARKAWQAASGSQMVPDVVKVSDGESKLEWRSTLTVDTYNNDIKPPPAPPGSPPFATPLNTGNFAKTVFATNIRLIEPGGQVNFVQFALAASNDRSVVSRYPNQLNSLQVGRTGQGYQIGAGDTAISFSQLGTTLGLRGLNVQQQLGDWTVSGYGGMVSDSWEALYNRTPLDNTPARSRFVRRVLGTKVEYALAPGLKFFTTLQGYSDNVESLDAARVSQQPTDARALSTGLSYQDGPWTVTSEVAMSRFEERYQPARKGDALLVDGSYRQSSWSLRGGYHDIDPKFVSLSQSVPPGVKESYIGGDWTAASWVTVGVDYRNAASRTAGLILLAAPMDPALPPPFPVMATSSITRSLTSRANINFGTDFPGLALSLSNTANQGEDAQQHGNRNQNSNAALSYSSATWSGNFSLMAGKLANNGNPQGDSTTSGIQAQLGRTYTGTIIPWSFGWSLTAGEQIQRLTFAGTETRSRSHGLMLNGQRAEWAQFTLAYQGSSISQTTGGPELLTRSVQLDVAKQLGPQNSFKAYLRATQRNLGDVALRTDERVVGIQLNLGW
ncbi:MAG: hypothetical protein LH481_13180 [Burkholderiales bacterium]|nr:hypothetical protein [Burkholderiales bacterium]